MHKPLISKRKSVLVDNSSKGKEVIGGIKIFLPVNRNLSEKLFGQLKKMMEQTN